MGGQQPPKKQKLLLQLIFSYLFSPKNIVPNIITIIPVFGGNDDADADADDAAAADDDDVTDAAHAQHNPQSL